MNAKKEIKRVKMCESQMAEMLTVIYKDQYVLVIDKPAGLASNALGGWSKTVPNVLNNMGLLGKDVKNAGIVSRLDVGTSGLMAVARTDDAYEKLKKQYKMREVSKIYKTLARGSFENATWVINAPIGRVRSKKSVRFACMEDGREAITHFRVLEKMHKFTLLSAKIDTGRTHQIRVHLNAMNRSVVGDTQYSPNLELSKKLHLNRQWLHSSELIFDHPITKQHLHFTSNPPQDLENALALARCFV